MELQKADSFRILDSLSASALSGCMVLFTSMPADQLFTAARCKPVNCLLIWVSDANPGKAAACLYDIWPAHFSRVQMRFRLQRLFAQAQTKEEAWESEQFLDTAINSTPNLVWFKDIDGVHIKVNDAFCETVGKDKSRVVGRTHNEIWDTSMQDPAQETDCSLSDQECIQLKRTCRNEEVVHTAGQEKYLTTYKSPLYTPGGAVMGTVGIGIDSTREKKFESEAAAKNRTLQKIISTVDCGILCHSLDGAEIISVNQNALDILDFENQEDLVNSGFLFISHSVFEEDRQSLIQAIQAVKEVGDSADAEYRVLHKDGTVHHILGTIKMIEDQGRRYYQRFLMDITKQRRRELEKDQQHNELIQALSVDFSFVCFVNLVSLEIMELRTNLSETILTDLLKKNPTLRDHLEESVRSLVYEEDQNELCWLLFEGGLEKELEKQPLCRYSFRYRHENQLEYYEMKAVRSGAWSEQIHGCVIGFHSVDESMRKELEQRKLLEDALVQARQASQAKTIFLSNMSHDIRTPINAIIGFCNLAISRFDDASLVRKYLQRIKTSGNLLLKLINDILDMSSIESGRFELNESLTSMSAILKNLNAIIRADAVEKNLDYKIVADPFQCDQVWCDELRLNQALMNVLSNSIKYTNPGGTIRFSVEEAVQGEHLVTYRFTIQDTGIGMSEDYVQHVYELFSRERNSTVSGVQGTGLGMAITKSIIDMMHGSIDLTSRQNEGTTVVITLPMRRSTPEEALNADHSQTDKLARTKKGCLLLVEDNELNQEIAREILLDEGFSVETADHGAMAVEKLLERGPGFYQAVLMDIQMPVMNGYQAAREIRRLEDEELRSIPIIAMTANAFEEDKLLAMQAGMNGHVAKPIDTDELFDILAKL